MTKRTRAAVEADDDFEGDDTGAETTKTEAEIRAEVLAYVDEVRSLCRLAGKPNLADAYVKAAKPVSDIVKDLEAKRESDDKAARERAGKGKKGADADGVASGEVSAHNSGVTTETTATEIDTSAVWAKWNRKKK